MRRLARGMNRQRTVPSRVNFDALDSRLSSTCCSRMPSIDTVRGSGVAGR